MSATLSNFRIEALHNSKTIDIPIVDNRLILVGENGTGKSTVANLVYFFLSRQWFRMLAYDFRRVVAVLDNHELTIDRSDILPSSSVKAELLSKVTSFQRSPSTRRAFAEIERTLSGIGLAELIQDSERIYQMAHDLAIPPSVIRDYLYEFSRLSGDKSLSSKKLQQLEKSISAALIADQILLLPTYRRIEQDLRSIFPGMEDDVQLRMRRRIPTRRLPEGFVELVEFGMQDVEEMISRKMDSVKEKVRTGLNELTGKYLRDVIRGSYKAVDITSALREIDEKSIDAILSRIPQAILSDDDKQILRRTISNITAEGEIEENDQVVTHYLAQLVDLYREQQAREKDIRDFVRVCNQYLLGKQVVYDDTKFETVVKAGNETLGMNMLSSGEKQIVSLFSHIYLAEKSGYFVVIDEPELSLSVPWQKRFLPDILNTGRCRGLVAVTHSPFIYDNELDSYTHSLEDFLEPVDVIR